MHLREIDIELAVFIFAEVEYLVYQPAEYPDILVSYLHQNLLLWGEVFGPDKLLYRLGYQCQRCAQVMRDVGEEDEFRLSGGVELFV